MGLLGPIKSLLPPAVRVRLKRWLTRPDFPADSRAIRKLRAIPRNTHSCFKILGKEIELSDPHWFLHSYQELLVQQIYRFETSNPRPRIIDCGANIGLSVIFFKYLFPGAEIVAFEPDAEIFGILSRNLTLFGFKNIELVNKAVWVSDSILSFEPDGSVGGRLSSSPTNQPVVPVESVRLRDYLGTPIDLLKIDIEGAEYEVLMDCRDALEYVVRIFVEYHGKPAEDQKLQEILGMLRAAGFRYHIQDANPIQHPFLKEERSLFYDLQVNIFGYRE